MRVPAEVRLRSGVRRSGVRRSGDGSLRRWLGVALSLHVLGAALIASFRERLAPVSAAAQGALPLELPLETIRSAPPAALIWIETEDAAERAEASTLAPTRVPAAAGVLEPEPAAAGAPERPPEARRAPGAASAELAAAGAAVAGVAIGEAIAEQGSEPSGEEEAEGDGSAPAPDTPAARLSPQALGIDPGHNPFLLPDRPASARGAREALGRHIDHVLRSGLAERDQIAGLGPEGPAVQAVVDLVMQSAAAPNTTASLSLRTDASGETLYVEVRDASSDTAAWDGIARDLLKALRGKKLRVPPGSGGVSMVLRVTSRDELPSGADPGLAIELFGQEIKSGAGKQATRLQLLKPRVIFELVEIPTQDGRTTTVPAVGVALTVVGLEGDPLDLGKVARRVVRAHLVSLETHPQQVP